MHIPAWLCKTQIEKRPRRYHLNIDAETNMSGIGARSGVLVDVFELCLAAAEQQDSKDRASQDLRKVLNA
jgi:hypothetical protein